MTQPSETQSSWQEGDSRPIPDPTRLTSRALERETTTILSLLDARIVGIVDNINERFRGVEAIAELSERQRVEQKKDTKDAVDAALTAQKEAVKEQTIASDRAIAKSEAAITKQLEQLSATFTIAVEGVRRDIDGLKERINLAEGQGLGTHSSYLFILAMLGAVGSFIAIVVATGAFHK